MKLGIRRRLGQSGYTSHMVTLSEATGGCWKSLPRGVSQGGLARPLHKGLVRREKEPQHLCPKRGWPAGMVLRKGQRNVPLQVKGPFLELWCGDPNCSRHHAAHSSRVLYFPEHAHRIHDIIRKAHPTVQEWIGQIIT